MYHTSQLRTKEHCTIEHCWSPVGPCIWQQNKQRAPVILHTVVSQVSITFYGQECLSPGTMTTGEINLVLFIYYCFVSDESMVLENNLRRLESERQLLVYPVTPGPEHTESTQSKL